MQPPKQGALASHETLLGKQSISVEKGFQEGHFELPHLSPKMVSAAPNIRQTPGAS